MPSNFQIFQVLCSISIIVDAISNTTGVGNINAHHTIV